MLLGSEVMQIKVKDFIEKIENQAYRHETILADKEDHAHLSCFRVRQRPRPKNGGFGCKRRIEPDSCQS